LHSAVAEFSVQKGHDLILFSNPMPAFEDQVIDHREIYDECKSRYGKPIELAIKSTYNPKTNKYFGFSPFFVPCPANYRKDLWEGVGVFPDTWDDVRIGGQKIKKAHGNTVWINLSDHTLSDMALRSIMYSFGSSVQDEAGNVVLNSKQTLDVVKFVKALYQETMSKGVISWYDYTCDIADQFIISGEASLLLSGISVTRTAERDKPELSKKIQITKTPQGPARRMGQYFIPTYFIWSFAENVEGAKQFLVDFVGNFQKFFLVGKFRDFPCFPDSVSDLKKLIANDARGQPPTKYNVLGDVLEWTANMGYPGYTHAAIEEVASKHVIPKMFSEAATGKVKPEDAIKDAEEQCKHIFSGWRARGLI
jgi:multiple sugar transport system substrate-binding protein